MKMLRLAMFAVVVAIAPSHAFAEAGQSQDSELRRFGIPTIQQQQRMQTRSNYENAYRSQGWGGEPDWRAPRHHPRRYYRYYED